MNLVEQVKRAGVVGAGGGGFPTHVKLAAEADIVIANGAECEPLLHKDAAVMELRAAEIVKGLRLTMGAVGASEGIVGVKARKQHAVEAMQAACRGTPLRVHLLGDYCPAGDEYDLVYTVTGRLIPPAGIPLQVGVVVCSVETFANIAAAAEGQAVTLKTLTIAGAVRQPVTLTVPVGASFRECLAAAGGATTPDPVLCLGGLMMGETTEDLDTPVVKTATGAVVLPRNHHVAQRKHPWAALCCACGLCTLFACPEELFPKEACDQSKAEMKRGNLKWTGPAPVQPHPMRDGRRVPIKSLMRRLHVEEYDDPAPLQTGVLAPRRVVLPLKQGAGAANKPLVRTGERVAAGQPLGAIEERALGAIIHAPFAATVAEVTDRHIALTR